MRINRNTGQNFRANKIRKFYETGNSTVHVSPIIVCAKEINQMSSVGNVTMIVDINAFGSHVHPVLIFPRLYLKNDILTRASAVSIGGANPTVWSN